MAKQIPHPPALPFIGNALDLRDEIPIRALANLSDTYGPIFQLSLRGEERVFITDVALVEECCDETRFSKTVLTALAAGESKGAASGLFTNPDEKDPDWGQAHRILMPAFGPLAIRDMFDEMYDVASQLVLKWARMGSEHKIPVNDDFTRLTLDTIALCSMDYRFNSFYSDDLHPFVTAMSRTFKSAGRGTTLMSLIRDPNKDVERDREYLQEMSKQLVRDRRENMSEKKDLLNSMMNGRDPKTGEGMRDDLIAANMITFLIAGHETTSGTLSFAFANLLKNPQAYRLAREEIDRVVGKGRVMFEHLKDLKYINAVLRETLRLYPTAPAFLRWIREENKEENPTLGGYEMQRGIKIMALVSKSQRDPKVFGEDANDFKPERMLDEKFDKLPKGAWKPFGTGLRGCIGRPFAWQEALLTTAMVLQTFDLRFDDPTYEVQIKFNFTLKPKEYYMRASLRPGIDPMKLQATLVGIQTNGTAKGTESAKANTSSVTADGLNPMTILYGSNTGTCQSLAQKLASEAHGQGFDARVLDMDAAIDKVPRNQPVVVITASYEGEPPDNAAHFVEWLQSTCGKDGLNGLHYAVFGCGHRDWASTFQKVPIVVDEIFESKGGSRLHSRGSSDASNGDMFGDFDSWSEKLWPAIKTQFSGHVSSEEPSAMPEAAVEVEFSDEDRASTLRQDVVQAIVHEARSLVSDGESEKRHLEITLPDEVAYEPGDYLAVLPKNPEINIRRVLEKFKISPERTIIIKASGPTTLPVNVPMAPVEILRGYVELAQPATRKDIQKLSKATTDASEKSELDRLSTTSFKDEIVDKHISVLDLLDRFPGVTLPFPGFLAMLPPMRLRHYSISSSPLIDPTRCSITYSVIEEDTAHNGRPFIGVAGSYLRSLNPGDAIQVSVRSANRFFRLPLDIDTIPIMMFCAGTGLAPFRGFIQQRAQQLKSHPERKLAPALLFIGCRSPASDRLYASELDEWSRIPGLVDIRYAFSQAPDHELAKGCKHVQDRMVLDRGDVSEMWKMGAKVFTCGSPKLAEGVGSVSKKLLSERFGEENLEEKLKSWKNERFVTDVFA